MRERLAIIGGGISGISAAYFLHKKYDITLFDKNNYVGGHAHMLEIDYDGTPLTIDTAVMIFDRLAYPNFEKLLASIGMTEADNEANDVSWGASFENGRLEYSNRSIHLQWNNTLSWRVWKMFYNYARFVWLAKRALAKDPASFEGRTFAVCLKELAVSPDCIDHIIAPFYGGVFALTREEILAWPAPLVLGFMRRQQMMNLGLSEATAWHKVRGGTRAYVERLTRPFQNAIELNAPVASLRRAAGKVVVALRNGTEQIFDKVIIAAHADEALQMLAQPTPDERALLRAFPYTRSRNLIVHNDSSVMPRRRSCWAALTCNDSLHALEGGIALTYWVNAIQNIDHQYPLFMSMNTNDIAPARRFAEIAYSHPAFTLGSHQAQKELHRLQGVGGIYFCGSYFGYACHEDAVVSAMAVSDLLGGEIPWKAQPTI
jgi:predicted NAD/FAD-binding protein